MATREIDLGEFNVAGVDRLRFTIKKDGVAWAGIDSVTLTFEKPDRSTVLADKACTLENDASGIWYYDTLVTDFPDEAASVGHWTVRVKVVDGTVTKFYPYEIGLEVLDQP